MGNAPAGQISPRGNCAIVVCLSRETVAATVPAAGLSQSNVSSHPNFRTGLKNGAVSTGRDVEMEAVCKTFTLLFSCTVNLKTEGALRPTQVC